MRDFFINALERVIGVLVVLMSIGVVIAAGGAMIGGVTTVDGTVVGGGIIPGLLVLLFGSLYVILMAGFMYLGPGIYQNTRRMAETMDRMAQKGI